MKYETVLFDLDGTLTASGEGITKSVQYALEKMGRGELGRDLKELEVFVGPPLFGQFIKYCNFTEQEAAQAVVYYRERYNQTGVYENTLYPGIQKLLVELKAAGLHLAVASSKPDHLVQVVLEHFRMAEFFEVKKGSNIQQPNMTKAEVIELVLAELGYEKKREQAVMVGDRFHDAEGAKSAGMDCIGVSYGYGGVQELERAGVIGIAGSAEELKQFLL